MNAHQSIVALIPARAGSVRLPGKNRAMVGRLSLVDRSIAHARALGAQQIVVTSDDLELRDSMASRPEVTFVERPPQLATADATTDDVIRHVIDAGQIGGDDLIVLLQPTSPFRNRSFLLACLQSAAQWPDHASISVAPAAKNPQWLKEMTEEGRLADVVLRGQPVVPNGSVYAFGVNALLTRGSLSNMKKVAVLSESIHSCDIDDAFELVCAQALAEAGYGDDVVDRLPTSSKDRKL